MNIPSPFEVMKHFVPKRLYIACAKPDGVAAAARRAGFDHDPIAARCRN